MEGFYTCQMLEKPSRSQFAVYLLPQSEEAARTKAGFRASKKVCRLWFCKLSATPVFQRPHQPGSDSQSQQQDGGQQDNSSPGHHCWHLKNAGSTHAIKATVIITAGKLSALNWRLFGSLHLPSGRPIVKAAHQRGIGAALAHAD